MLTRMTRMARMLTHMLTRMTRWLAGSHIIHTRLACLLTIKLQNGLVCYVYNLINYCKWGGLSLIKQSLLRYFAVARVIKINDMLY